jgi:hypothetical protein
MQLSPCSVCCRFLLIVTDATLVLAAEWWSNVVVAEAWASVIFHAVWDIARCFLLSRTIVSRSLVVQERRGGRGVG